jgi:hypothetical protein
MVDPNSADSSPPEAVPLSVPSAPGQDFLFLSIARTPREMKVVASRSQEWIGNCADTLGVQRSALTFGGSAALASIATIKCCHRDCAGSCHAPDTDVVRTREEFGWVGAASETA